MKRLRQGLIGLLGLALIGAVVGEEAARRSIQQRYHAAVATQQQLEAQFKDTLANYERLTNDLAQERWRSNQLTEELARRTKEFDETMVKLSEQSQTVRELQGRLASLQTQTEQLQGELAAVGAGAASQETTGKRSVELERIVVANGETAGFQGRIVSVHPEWDFIVIDLGWDAVKIGETVSIYRNEQLLGKARIERVQEGVCAATVLPDSQTDAIHVNDLVRIL